jgi:hypothetical protein
MSWSTVYLAYILGSIFSASEPSDDISLAQRVKQQLQSTAHPTIEQCSFIVVQIAHWDGGMLTWAPAPVSLYEQNMLKTVQRLHSCALGLINWVCPHADWRNPPFTDAYKKALQRVVAVASSTSSSNPPKYVDASFITLPLWDFTTDWSHSGDSVSDTRVLFVAATLLEVF